MLQALEARDLKMFSTYVGAFVGPEGPSYDPGLKQAIEQLQGHDTLLWLNMSAAAFEAGDMPYHKQLREHFHASIEMTILEGLENGKTAPESMQELTFAWLPAAVLPHWCNPPAQ